MARGKGEVFDCLGSGARQRWREREIPVKGERGGGEDWLCVDVEVRWWLACRGGGRYR